MIYMKRSHIFLIVFCVIMAVCMPVDAVCPNAVKKTTCQDTGCNLKPGTCSGNTCDAVKNSGNVCNANKVSKCSKTATTKKACNVAGKKTKCTTGCGKRTVCPVNSSNSTDENVSPVVPGEDNGTTIVKMCRSNVCTIGGAGKVLSLLNHANAVDPTYSQLIEFARADKTDEIPYKSNSFVCSDYAKTFHDNAEAAGIKTGWIGISSINHAFNVVNTTDRGLVYIDCTGQVGGGTLLDKELTVTKGSSLTGKYLFRDGSFSMPGTIGSQLVYW